MSSFGFEAVTRIEAEEYTGPVVNLQVAAEACFVAEGIVVHNCPHHGEPDMKGYVPQEAAGEVWSGGMPPFVRSLYDGDLLPDWSTKLSKEDIATAEERLQELATSFYGDSKNAWSGKIHLYTKTSEYVDDSSSWAFVDSRSREVHFHPTVSKEVYRLIDGNGKATEDAMGTFLHEIMHLEGYDYGSWETSRRTFARSLSLANIEEALVEFRARQETAAFAERMGITLVKGRRFAAYNNEVRALKALAEVAKPENATEWLLQLASQDTGQRGTSQLWDFEQALNGVGRGMDRAEKREFRKLMHKAFESGTAASLRRALRFLEKLT